MNYKITHMEYAHVEDASIEFFLNEFTTTDEKVLNPWGFTLVQGGGKNIMIDTGMNMENPAKVEMAAMAGASNAHSPKEVLPTVGITPEEVDAVILTHLHFDHASAIECYPNATFYVQNDEVEGWLEIRDTPKYSAIACMAVDWGDLDRLQKLEEQGKVVRLYGDTQDVFPGISVRKLSLGHTFASQIVLVQTEKGEFMIVGDGANRPENFLGTKDHPYYIPNKRFVVGAAYNIVKDYDMMLALTGGDISKIIMTHDDTKKKKYPHRTSGLGLEIYEIA